MDNDDSFGARHSCGQSNDENDDLGDVADSSNTGCITLKLYKNREDIFTFKPSFSSVI